MGNIHPYRADSAVFTAGTRRPFQAWFGVGLGRKTMGKIALSAHLLIAPMTGQAGPPPPRQGVEIVRHWLDLARRHSPGEIDDALTEFRRFTLADVLEGEYGFDAIVQFIKNPNLTSFEHPRRVYNPEEQYALARMGI